MKDFNISDVEKPYTYELTSQNFFGRCTFTLFFEGTPIKQMIGTHLDDVKTTVHLLNAAYILGFGSGFINGTMQYNNELKKVA